MIQRGACLEQPRVRLESLTYRGKRVTLMGLGRHGGGVGAALHLAAAGARLTVTDLAGEHALADSLSKLSAVRGIRYVLGEHRERDFSEADLIVVNPAVKPANPYVERALTAGVHLTTEIELFLQACPAKTVGVTGSNGKSTTSAMIAAILAADGRRAWLGGNNERSLLDELPCITADDWVVLELSSFQLARLNAGMRTTDVAVITNCTENHLDWHGTLDHYASSKQELLKRQPGDSLAVLNPFDERVQSWHPFVRGDCADLPALDSLPRLRVPGEHNRVNAACAAAATLGVGCSPAAIRAALAAFAGLPQRLEFVAEVQGRKFYSDSQATTPESTIVAIATLPGPSWLLAGGADKGSCFGPLAAAMGGQVRGAAFYGAVREKLSATVRAETNVAHVAVETLAEAFAWSWRHSQPGDTILLSPACSSLDQFRDWSHRGACFKQLVSDLPDRAIV